VIRRDKYGCACFILLAVSQIPGHAQGPNTWTTGAAMPTAVSGPATAVIGGSVYVVGGVTDSATVNTNQIYNPTTDSWTLGAPMPTARDVAARAVVNNMLYVIGGKLNGNQLKVVEAYDPATDTWATNYSPMPTARDSVKAVVNNGIIYVIGGFNNGGDRLKTVESYNPATDTWTEGPPLLVSKSSIAAALFGSTIVAAEGLTDSGATGDNEGYLLPAGPWKTLAPDPNPRWDTCSATIMGQLYSGGGHNNAGPLNVLESFNLAGNLWTTLAPMPLAVIAPGEAEVGDLLYCFGGDTQDGVRSHQVQIYHPGPAPQPAISAGGVVTASAFGAFPLIAPGSWIEIYGSNLAPDTQSWASLQTSAGTSAPIDITVNATEPGLLAPPSFKLAGIQYARALFVDNAYVLPEGAISGLNSRQAKPGDTVIFYGVGFGAVTPNIPSGQIVQEANMLVSEFQISIGGMQAMVNYAGLAPDSIGLYQFNVVVPNIGTSDAAPVIFTLDGASGTQALFVPVQN
jgi:Kelch motif